MKHADLTDIANETADLILDQALLHQSKVAAKAKRSYSEDCIECGDIIPAQRQQASNRWYQYLRWLFRNLGKDFSLNNRY